MKKFFEKDTTMPIYPDFEEVEREDIEDLEEEVEEAVEAMPEKKSAKVLKHVKACGKTLGKIGLGMVFGLGGAILLGMKMSRKQETLEAGDDEEFHSWESDDEDDSEEETED